jgi:hypothetical protein
MPGSSGFHRGVVWAGLVLFLSVLHGHAAGDWQVAEAPLRYKLSLTQKPTHPTAGYFVHLPDGGIFRGTTPATTVVTDDGKVLPSFVLWHNAESGFSIVFADPGSQRSVNVYTQPSAGGRYWRPNSGITPGAILCTHPGRDNIGAARALGSLGRVEAGVHFQSNHGIPRAPFSIGGDNTGRPRPAAFYLLSHVDATVAGSYWIAPFIHSGKCEILIDGNKINPKEHSKEWGGDGVSVELTRGIHRVEVFQTAPGTGPYSSNPRDGGLMFLTWRPPGEQIKNAESRVIRDSEIVRSGACSVAAVESREGFPVAAGVVKPGLCYWFEDEEPLIIYELNALTTGHPAGTTWTWTFPEGGSLDGAKGQWMFPGFRENKARLTVKSGQSVSSCIVPFFGFSTEKTSLENPTHRKAFRDTLAGMLAAFPKAPDPIMNWSEAWWNNLLRTVEGGEGYPLLTRLFTDRFDSTRKKLTPGQRYALEDVFLDLALRDNPADNFKWLQKFYIGTPEPDRQNELRFREGELQMYYLGDRNRAEKIFTGLAGVRGQIGERSRIRLGDLALLTGDLNKATAYYADVQNRARSLRNSAPVLPGGLVTNQLVYGGPARPTAPDPRNPQATPQKTGAAAVQKGGALQEVSLSENVRTLTETGFLLEARQAILAWEIEFPLSKISGDYILRESALYMKMEDWKRAQPMLEAYCREIDASSFLPDAASMLIKCVTRAKAPPAPVREIIEKVKGRLKYHPVASELDRFLSTAGAPPK